MASASRDYSPSAWMGSDAGAPSLPAVDVLRALAFEALVILAAAALVRSSDALTAAGTTLVWLSQLVGSDGMNLAGSVPWLNTLWDRHLDKAADAIKGGPQLASRAVLINGARSVRPR